MTEFYIEKKDWDKVISYAQAAWDEHRSEIGGMMVVVQDKDDDWQVQDPVILKQRISSGNTHLDKEELAKYYTKAAKKYKDNIFRFCWWHSHHTMAAFWSGTDTNTIDEFSDGDFSFALVVNLKEEYKFRVSIWKPFPMHSDVELNIMCNEKKFPKKLVDEVTELCSKPEVKSIGSLKGYGYKQRTLWNQQKKAGNVINYTTVDEAIHYDYSYAYNLMQKLIDGACAGTVQYSKYLEEIEEFNDKASLEETGILIGKLSEKDWMEAVMTTTPANHIIDTEMEAYNNSFEYHSRWGI